MTKEVTKLGYGCLIVRAICSVPMLLLLRFDYVTKPIRDAGGKVYSGSEGLSELAGRSGVRGVSLSGQEVNDAVLADPQDDLESFTGMRYLYLSDARISNKGLARLKNLSTIRRFWLDGTAITDKGLIHLKSCSMLERLDLTGISIVGDGLIHLQGVAHLSSLNLADTSVDDRAVDALAKMKYLYVLDLSGTRVTQAGVDRLKDLLPKDARITSPAAVAPNDPDGG